MATIGTRAARVRQGLAGVPRPPLLLAATVAAALAFVGAYLIGRATAPTREDLRAPTAMLSHHPSPLLVVLARAAALPAAPRQAKRPRSITPVQARAPSPDGKLIVGAG